MELQPYYDEIFNIINTNEVPVVDFDVFKNTFVRSFPIHPILIQNYNVNNSITKTTTNQTTIPISRLTSNQTTKPIINYDNVQNTEFVKTLPIDPNTIKIEGLTTIKKTNKRDNPKKNSLISEIAIKKPRSNNGTFVKKNVNLTVAEVEMKDNKLYKIQKNVETYKMNDSFIIYIDYNCYRKNNTLYGKFCQNINISNFTKHNSTKHHKTVVEYDALYKKNIVKNFCTYYIDDESITVLLNLYFDS